MMNLPEHCSDLQSLESKLGNPFDEKNPISYSSAMQLDEQDKVPYEAVQYLQDEGFMDYLIPKSLGGKLHSYQHLFYIIRQISRRDVTLATMYVLRAIGLGPVLVAGTPEQKAYYAKEILQGCGISWGVSEKEHGSDLIETSARAAEIADGSYLLNGSKWLIGGTSTCEMAIFFSRTGRGRGPDSFSLICVDSRKQKDGVFTRLPREKLYGVRGLDLAGFSLDNAEASKCEVIGKEGSGLELMLRTAQLHRVGAATMALGAMDTGLRIALSFAEMRVIFDKKLSEIPVTKFELVESFSEILLCEVAVSSATRALHYYPKGMFLLAAIAKIIVPTLSSDAFSRMARAIGARYFLRENFAYGLFQKAMRDAEMTSFVDGNEKVNLKNISLHMEVTLPYVEKNDIPSNEDRETFAQFNDLHQFEPDAQFSSLSVFSGRKDNSFIYLNDSITKLKGRLTSKAPDSDLTSITLLYAHSLQTELSSLIEDLKSAKAELGKNYNYSPQSYKLAERYALVHCGADCIHNIVYTDFDESISNLSWAPICLYSILKRLNSSTPLPGSKWVEETFEILLSKFNMGHAFSFLPLTQAEPPHAFCSREQMNL